MEMKKWLVIVVAILLVVVVLLADMLGVPPHVARMLRDALALLIAATATVHRLYGL